MSVKILLFSFCALPLFAEEGEIRVHLATSSQLHPLYIGKIQAKDSTFDPSYLSQIEGVIHYDLNYNGSTKVVPVSSDKEQILLAETPFQASAWKKAGVRYVIRQSVQARVLSVSVFDVELGNLKTCPPLSLTGNLNSDRKLIHSLADAIHKALFSEDGIASTRILYAYQVKNPRSDGSEWISEIWECDWDGALARQLTHDNSYSVTPVAIPHHPSFNNDKFLYVSYKMGQPKIYIGSLKGGEGKRLIDLRGNQLLPAVSLKRDKIAFICDAGGRTDLFLQPLNPATAEAGKPVQLYSYPRSTQASPTFSPDGSKIAFVSDKDGGMRIYIIPASPSQKRPSAQMLSKQNRENSCPCWSPDGTKLAYSAKTNGIRQIWIYDFSTGEETQLTSGAGNKENPCWAPNSKHIVFNSTDNSNSELYIVNLNQPEAVKISRSPGKKHYPTWGAR
jgi:TolB protein